MTFLRPLACLAAGTLATVALATLCLWAWPRAVRAGVALAGHELPEVEVRR